MTMKEGEEEVVLGIKEGGVREETKLVDTPLQILGKPGFDDLITVDFIRGQVGQRCQFGIALIIYYSN